MGSITLAIIDLILIPEDKKRQNTNKRTIIWTRPRRTFPNTGSLILLYLCFSNLKLCNTMIFIFPNELHDEPYYPILNVSTRKLQYGEKKREKISRLRTIFAPRPYFNKKKQTNVRLVKSFGNKWRHWFTRGMVSEQVRAVIPVINWLSYDVIGQLYCFSPPGGVKTNQYKTVPKHRNSIIYLPKIHVQQK